MNEPSGHRPAL